jgi:Spy/CpxP family protein refolding chaperone
MKRILTTALAIVLFAGASQAQDKGRGHGRHGGDKFATELNLTAEQKAKLKSIREQQKAEMETLRKTGSVTPEQRKTLHEKYKSQVEAVYTPGQKEQLNKLREEWKAKGKDGKEGKDKGKDFGKKGGEFGRRGEGFGQQGAFFKKELNLSAEQETKLKGIFQEFQAKSKDLRSNSSLSQEQKKEQMQSLVKQYMGQGKSVLNADQLKKLDAMQAKRKDKRK